MWTALGERAGPDAKELLGTISGRLHCIMGWVGGWVSEVFIAGEQVIPFSGHTHIYRSTENAFERSLS